VVWRFEKKDMEEAQESTKMFKTTDKKGKKTQ
jgi:hypothetical protein